MSTRNGENRWMKVRPWRAWVGVVAVFVGMAVARPVRAEGPPKKAPAAASTGQAEAERLLEETVRLIEEVQRLTRQRKLEDVPFLMQRSIANTEKALGPSHPDFAVLLGVLVVLCDSAGLSELAEPLHERAVAILEKAVGPKHPDVAHLTALATLYHRKKDYARAEPLYERALAIQEETFEPESPEVAAILDDLAGLHHDQEDDARAESLYERALPGLEKLYGHEDIRLYSALKLLATRSKGRRDYVHAEPLYQRLLAISERSSGPDHPDVAGSLDDLADLYLDMWDFTRAELLYKRALAIREKAFGQDHPDIVMSVTNLGLLYDLTWDYVRAEPLYQRALAIREKAFGPDHPSLAAVLGSLAWLYVSKGDYARAEPLLQRALAIVEKSFGHDHPDVVTRLSSLAALHMGKGDHARAEALLQRALAIKERALDHFGVVEVLIDLAEVHQATGDYTRAESLLQRALAIFEKEVGPDHPAIIYILYMQARLYFGKDEPARAEPLLQRVLTFAEKAFGPDSHLVAEPLEILGLLCLDNGDFPRAESMLQRALAVAGKTVGRDDFRAVSVRDSLMALYIAQGRSADAVSLAGQSIDIRDRHASAILAVGSEEQKRYHMNRLARQTDMVVSLHVQTAPGSQDAARFALTVLLRRKGRILDAMTDGLAALRRSVAPADRDMLDRLASVYSRLAAHASRGPEDIPVDQYRKNLVALDQEREAMEAEVGKRSATFLIERRLLGVKDVQAALPERAALVEIARYSPVHASRRGRGKPRYVAYVLRRSGEPTFADLGDSAIIDAAAEKLRVALADRDRTHDPRPAARALDKLLMAPIRQLLGDARWVFVSPDGPLHLVPFGALVDENDHYLVERYLFSYVTTGRDLLRFGDKHPSPREAPLVLANPSFDDSSAPPLPAATHRGLRSIDMVARRLPPLDGTADEARTIAQLFPDSRVLMGTQATEEAVKAVRAPRLLHLATHGFFLPEQPVPDALLHYGPGGEPTPAERAALVQRENPLLRSGVALAGFNRRQSGSDDGVLTALEVAGLDLYGTRLVVLSTCESGVGEASSGEGVYGLRRALVMAGAETQVMSLWQVDTGRTRELMQAYYEKLRDGGGRSEAMREVQLAMLATPATAHPNLWASFIVSGEWRTLEGKARLPDVGKVSPGLRGCSCQQAGSGQTEAGAWLMLALGLAAMGRRRSTDARVRRGGGDLR